MSAIVKHARAYNPPGYPESDGLPMAENSVQFRWITTIEGGLEAVFRDDPLVFVAGDHLWYPVEGDNKIRSAPDIYVAFGRPKGDRGSYLQWLEDDIAPQVVFEIASPGNRAGQLHEKFLFYEKYGVEEYYFFDPDRHELKGWVRTRKKLKEIPQMNGWVSPRCKIRFEFIEGEMSIYGPDGKKFATYLELVKERENAIKATEKAKKEKARAQKEKEKTQGRADRLAAQLKALGIEPEA